MGRYDPAGSRASSAAEPTAIGNVSFGDTHPELPSEVTAGIPVTVTLAVSNNATFISPTDTDVCYDLGGGSGYKTTVSAFANGREKAATSDCFPAEESWTWRLNLGSFQPGSYALRFTVEGSSSGRIADEFTHTLNVTPADDSDDGNNNPPPPTNRGFWAGLTDTEKQVAIIGGAAAVYALLK